MRIFIMLFWYHCLAYIGDAETQNNICVSYIYAVFSWHMIIRFKGSYITVKMSQRVHTMECNQFYSNNKSMK